MTTLLNARPRNGIAVKWRTFRKHIPGATKDQYADYLSERAASHMQSEMANSALAIVRASIEPRPQAA